VLRRSRGRLFTDRIERVAAVDTGVIGPGWAARRLAYDLDVIARLRPL
jgi:hypothetical protein